VVDPFCWPTRTAVSACWLRSEPDQLKLSECVTGWPKLHPATDPVVV
jgi:hypothetical protein